MSYQTLSEAKAVLVEYRPDLSCHDISDKHLVFADSILDQLQWVGKRVISTQDNAWPREAVLIDSFDWTMGYRSSDSTPIEILRIHAELAMRFALDPNILDDPTQPVKVGTIIIARESTDLLGTHLRSRIKPFLVRSGGLYKAN